MPVLALVACGGAPDGGDRNPDVTITVSALTFSQASAPVVGTPHEVTFQWTTAVEGADTLTCVLSFGDASPVHVIQGDCLGSQSVTHTYASFRSPTTANVVVTHGGVSKLQTVTLRVDPGDGSITDEQAAWLELVNLARSVDQLCSGTLHPAVPPLDWDERVGRAAQLHTEYMAANNRMSHGGPPGLEDVGERVSAQGYNWNYVSENIAHGQRTAAAAVLAWLSSPGHCRNIMSPVAEDFGMGYATNAAGQPYWTQNFARER